MTFRKGCLVAAICGALLSLGNLASAGVIHLAGSNADGTQKIGTGATDDGIFVDITIGGFPQLQDFAGRRLATITDFAGLNYVGQAAFDVYCVDLGQGVAVPGTYPLTDDLMSNWGLGGSGLDGQEAAYLYNTYAGVVSNGVQRAGLQLAIWEGLFDGAMWGTSFNLSSGRFTVTNADAGAIAFANQIGASLLSSNAAWLKLQLSRDSDYPQDFIGPLKGVPEPASWLLMAAGLSAVANRVRRRRPSRA